MHHLYGIPSGQVPVKSHLDLEQVTGDFFYTAE